ncbi:MAG: aspartate carbamoyltransferase [Patescibacteria group bacterium]
MSSNPFYKKHYTTVDNLTRANVMYLMQRADFMLDVISNKSEHIPLKNKHAAILFYQPSTRTYTSFHAAACRLGMTVTGIQGMSAYSSAVKGETLADTIKTVYQTTGADVIVLRHPDDDSSETAAKNSYVPVINAGSGKREHPTQALLDLHTIYKNVGRIDNLNIVMVGDHLFGRTTKSLAKLLGLVGENVKVTFVAPKELQVVEEFIGELAQMGLAVELAYDLGTVLDCADVVYMTRVQKEWFEDAGRLEDYKRLKDSFILTPMLAEEMKPESIIMHPLPRTDELPPEVDTNPRARYFKQMRSGLALRMALLESILLAEVV